MVFHLWKPRFLSQKYVVLEIVLVTVEGKHLYVI